MVSTYIFALPLFAGATDRAPLPRDQHEYLCPKSVAVSYRKSSLFCLTRGRIRRSFSSRRSENCSAGADHEQETRVA
jgi:hypothetical protein